jgi:hypothetical protein
VVSLCFADYIFFLLGSAKGWKMTDRDNLQRRCPRLGGPVSFGYCRTCGEGKGPCFKVLDCWWERFDVVGYFQHSLPPAEFERLRCASPPDKVVSLVTLIRQAQERTRESGK